ncbi:amidohydrolase [Pseudomassariella vexata]|uniref:Amidohydrolase n=1 Tax=Pseudomassariella vexata TaxID=1141098 RepID=A0A1Y2E6Z7_9PEZI|nr:amidohydrolase [Pseudomassariella vexata]ORY67056.1 amidohydrolase [Pseudomassariella vexata]
MTPDPSRSATTSINNVILPCRDSNTRWDIEVAHGSVKTIQPCADNGPKSNIVPILLPALCHPHIHLDKPYILTCNHTPTPAHPDYFDLAPSSGSFSEALLNTSRAKNRYTAEDLYLRGCQLLATSYTQGVTSVRAFVELDHVTGSLALTTAIQLKREFSHIIEVQICAFAQDPIFSTMYGERNRSIITSALVEHGAWIGALGTTPYVEASREASEKNVEWAIATALEYVLHLDFHLDYNLESWSYSTPLTFSVIELLQKHHWPTGPAAPTVMLGHCTQLTTLPKSDLSRLSVTILSTKLPVHFVGLPTSDLFMMGRPSDDQESSPYSRPRGTLQIPSMIKDLEFSACLGVNNVGNAFTPYGTGDPLQLACFGVGVYQAGTPEDAKTLYSCVSWLARRAIGLRAQQDGDIAVGDEWQPMLRIENKPYITVEGKGGQPDLIIPARQRLDFKDVVWDPPEVGLRSIVRG